MTIYVAGLGPAGPEFITQQVRHAIEQVPRRFLRTRRHPSAAVVDGADAFDDLYEQSDTFQEVYEGIAHRLLAEAAHGDVLYAVPGSPLVAERSVELLRSHSEADVVILAGLSFVDLAWQRLGVDPLAAGVRLVDARQFAVQAAGEQGPLLVAQCDTPFVLSEIKLAAEHEPDEPVVLLQRLGLEDEQVTELAWDDLDRNVQPDHLTSLYVPRLATPISAEVARFAELAVTLRRSCPWDSEQTHHSLRPHLLEETYEVLEAIDAVNPNTGDGYEALAEELGDLLYQVVFHSLMAAEQGRFTLADVARGIHDKLVARHPHVFGDAAHGDWEAIKRAEKGRTSAMDGIPPGLPALLYAAKVQSRAANAGLSALAEESVDAAHVAGRIYKLVAEARAADIDAETELHSLVSRIADRLRAAEETPPPPTD